MGKHSSIQWCDHTFNPWIGCQRVSEGCRNCYAEHDTFARRERAAGRNLWGPNAARHRTSEDYWHGPIKWSYESWVECANCGWRGHLRMELFGVNCPLCGELQLQPTRQRVFCASLCDVLEDRTDLLPWRNDLFDLIEQTPGLDWLLLTKRIELAPSLLPYTWFNGDWPKNVWMGTSVETQKTADARLPELLKCPAPVRFLSVEPMLEPVDLCRISGDYVSMDVLRKTRFDYDLEGQGLAAPMPVGVNWCIVGGESGSKCRPFDWEWARALRDQCAAARVPYFMKQGGGHPDKRDQMEDFPEDLRIREWPK